MSSMSVPAVRAERCRRAGACHRKLVGKGVDTVAEPDPVEDLPCALPTLGLAHALDLERVGRVVEHAEVR
ncbi:hypothetical protein GCM10023065_31220 [Microbacterium laevaniformans]